MLGNKLYCFIKYNVLNQLNIASPQETNNISWRIHKFIKKKC